MVQGVGQPDYFFIENTEGSVVQGVAQKDPITASCPSENIKDCIYNQLDQHSLEKPLQAHTHTHTPLFGKDHPSCPLVLYNFLNQRRFFLSQIHPEALPKYFLGPSYIGCVKRDVSFLILCDIGWHAGWPWRIIGTHTAPTQDVQLHTCTTQTNITSRHTYVLRQTQTGQP